MLSGLMPPSMLLLMSSVVGMGAVEGSRYVFHAVCIRLRWPRVNLEGREGKGTSTTQLMYTHAACMLRPELLDAQGLQHS